MHASPPSPSSSPRERERAERARRQKAANEVQAGQAQGDGEREWWEADHTAESVDTPTVARFVLTWPWIGRYVEQQSAALASFDITGAPGGPLPRFVSSPGQCEGTSLPAHPSSRATPSCPALHMRLSYAPSCRVAQFQVRQAQRQKARQGQGQGPGRVM
jgi:hypothetical protein